MLPEKGNAILRWLSLHPERVRIVTALVQQLRRRWLEISCPFRGTGGSNPSLSAIRPI